jgi:hypothetical protein
MRGMRESTKEVCVRRIGYAWLTAAVVACGCGGGSSPAGPTSPSGGGLPVPVPTGATSGRVENAETVADLITYNQAERVGLSLQPEGVIDRATGIITRWELPVPVYVDPSITGDCVSEAMAYWQSVTGISYVFVNGDAEARITVRAAGSDELNVSSGLGLVYRTYPNNRAKLGVVKILTSAARCSAPSALFRHELGHAIGIFGHPPGGLMASPMIGSTATQRDINLLTQLYRLPHGTTINADGSWSVVQ